MIRILLFGAPGSGKGTVADLLQKKLGYRKFSTGDLVREEVKSGSKLGREIQGIMEKGSLVSDDVIISMVKIRIGGEQNLRGYILDGFPRTLPQVKALENLESDREVAVFLDVSEETVVERLQNRLTCSSCGAIYHRRNLPPKKEGVCDLCGGNLIRRPDDEPDTVRRRIKVYQEQTSPVIEYYRNKNQLITVSGFGTPEEVFEKVEVYVS